MLVFREMISSLSKRVLAGFAATAVGVTMTACGGGDTAGGDFDGEIKVGILHSLSGTMAISETTLKEVEEMAIKEINDAGGVKIDDKSYKITYVSEDGASDWPTFAEKSQKLIDADKVAVVFGGWTSASRKAMLPVYEAKDHFLFYPIQYEGQECSKNIFYTGAVPNQQAEPAVDWLFEKFADKYGKKVYLVGSDYVYPRTANTIIKEQVKSLGGVTVGEDYIPLGNTEVAPIIAKIKKEFPDGGIIINTLNGDSNVHCSSSSRQLASPRTSIRSCPSPSRKKRFARSVLTMSVAPTRHGTTSCPSELKRPTPSMRPSLRCMATIG